MAELSQPEPPFDFTGYVLLDGLVPSRQRSEICTALASDFNRADETRFHVRKTLSPEMCVIFKFSNEENAQEMIKRYQRRRVPLRGLRGLIVAPGLKALSDLERALTGVMGENVFETRVKVETFGFRGGLRDIITSALSPFGEIIKMRGDGVTDTGVITSVWFKYYSSALACQVACHGEKMRRQGVFVVPLRKRMQVTNQLLKWATQFLEPDQKNKLQAALWKVSF